MKKAEALAILNGSAVTKAKKRVYFIQTDAIRDCVRKAAKLQAYYRSSTPTSLQSMQLPPMF